MCDCLKDNIVKEKSPNVESTMVYHQGRERQTLADKGVIRRENSFSSIDCSVSRNSSFSSYSSSATGSSGYSCALDTDSSAVGRTGKSTGLIVGLESSLKAATMTKPKDLSCSRKLITTSGKHRKEATQRDMDERTNSLSNQTHTHPSKKVPEREKISTRPFSLPERSNSETEIFLPRSNLSSPEGLIISTPPAKGTNLSASEKRARSKSESYDEKNAHSIENTKQLPKDLRKSKRSGKQAKRRETTAVDRFIDETTMKRCLVLLETNCESRKGRKIKDATRRIAALESQVEQVCQERDTALQERNEIIRDRDRIKCERDALEVERYKLLRDKERLEKELINRSNVIDHLKEHLGLAVIPIKLTARTLNCPVTIPKEASTTYDKDAPAGSKFKTRPRSKSEIRTPEFYFPDQILKTNAYTCL